MYAESVEALLKFQSLQGIPAKLTEEFREAFRVSGWPGFLRRWLETLEARAKTNTVEPFQFANLYVRLGERDKAFGWLEKTFEARDPLTLQFKVDPAYDSLRNDPRYVQSVRKIGLQP